MLVIGYGLYFNGLFIFLKPLRKCTWFVLGLSCANNGDSHSGLFDISRTPSRTKHSTSSLDISLCTFGNLYGIEHIGFTSSFNSKSTGSVFHVPSVPLKNALDFCNSLIIFLRCTSVRCCHWFSITLFKFAFSYLASKLHVII